MNNLGIRNNARSPGSIQNMQYNDASQAQKGLNGTGGVPDSIVADSTVLTPVAPRTTLRITNTTGTTAYVYIGPASTAPGGAPTILNGLAIPGNTSDIFFTPELKEQDESWAVKSSATTVQVVILKP